jgi:hypothetical protein
VISIDKLYNLHNLHKNSLPHKQMPVVENTFLEFSQIFVAILPILYYNGKEILTRKIKAV